MADRYVFISLALAFSAMAHAADTSATADSTGPRADVEKGRQIATQICAACHNPDGNSTVAANPKLAGQHADYLYKQLKNFKSEGNKPAERNNPVMGGMVAALTEQDMRNVAAFYASQTLIGEQARSPNFDAAQKLYRAGDPARGLPACAACHGPAGTGIPAQFPRIGGQFAEYTEAQLKAFREGSRANDPNRMMRAVAARMSDAEIKAIADYVAGLR